MSDLLAPILFVTQNEVESFWCLTGFMDLVVSIERGPSEGPIVVQVKMWWVLSDVPPVQHQNFEESQEAMKQQLLQLSILLKALDPELYDFLGR